MQSLLSVVSVVLHGVVFENRVLRRREEVAGGWRRLHNEELHNSYASPNIVSVIKSKRVRWRSM
jgi:hypothetical protein